MSPLLSPPPATALAAFPSLTLAPARRLYRIHRVDHGPWFFASADRAFGRFDLRPPLGTCYVALERVGAFLEAFQAVLPTIPQAEVAARRVSMLHVPTAVHLADCTSEMAAGFGITGEIHSSADRAVTRAWAESFSAAGFAGILYAIRHDPSQRCRAVALFGPAGVPNAEAFPSVTTRPIGRALIAEAARRFGVAVLPHPSRLT